VEEHARNADGVRQAVTSLEERVSSFEARMDARFTALEANLNARFALIEGQITRLTTSVMTALAAVVAVAGGLLLVLR